VARPKGSGTKGAERYSGEPIEFQRVASRMVVDAVKEGDYPLLDILITRGMAEPRRDRLEKTAGFMTYREALSACASENAGRFTPGPTGGMDIARATIRRLENGRTLREAARNYTPDSRSLRAIIERRGHDLLTRRVDFEMEHLPEKARDGLEGLLASVIFCPTTGRCPMQVRLREGHLVVRGDLQDFLRKVYGVIGRIPDKAAPRSSTLGLFYSLPDSGTTDSGMETQWHVPGFLLVHVLSYFKHPSFALYLKHNELV